MKYLKLLHDVKLFRSVAKKLLIGFPVKQKFYTGHIYMDAVDHSWAWTGSQSYEAFDRELQDKLYELSLSKSKLIDIGNNIGAISLGILLRNKTINVIAIEPNPFAIKYFRKSLKKNKLTNRCNIIEAVVSSNNLDKGFDLTGSVVGHISNDSKLKVKSLIFWDSLRELAKNDSTLVKIDIEGYETDILYCIPLDVHKIKNLTMVFELHPKGFNKIGDPNLCIKKLKESGFKVFDFYEQDITNVNEDEFSQILVRS